ncbi:SDR family oxidoreductase [Cellulomonas sp. C5510]|uniref:SDR family oxidoreductase n=1 Tax=Cellulomonas sp. C5510 TaxID=2871170 RepID=UPI001C946E34|nr:SDR family oxidoreductase [Cellulomonas sp. C5510]QZN85192.1 SDR family oxidoreductase [Cellulomonas sp. C5510]
MKIFVTGASGHIGSAVVPLLQAAGHEVLGLARSDASAAVLEARGVDVLRAGLADLDALRGAAAGSDGVVHLAFVHDFADFDGAVVTDRAAVEAMSSVLVGTGRPFVSAAGTPVVPGRVATEGDLPAVGGALGARAETGRALLALADQGVRSSLVGLPRTVHDDHGNGGFAAGLAAIARQAGVSGYVGDGSARWPAVHVDDAAAVFVLALEQAPGGSVLHAVGEEGVTLLDTATAIGRALDVPVESVEPERLGFLGALAGIDQPASAALTRERYGWEPTGLGLLASLAGLARA